ncbi:MAG: hypothetical protein KC418_02105 [Anaerolineales bacterium]|nr:hypothetical protein [Anaerolineales bacterium]MCB8954338.1 hypothetical protein [Ardenticatenales bacterium]
MNKNTLRNWGIVVILLIFSGLASVGWPILRGQLSGGARIERVRPPEPPITLSLPELVSKRVPASMLNEAGNLEMEPPIALAVLAAIAIGGIAVTGGLIAFAYTLIDRGVQNAKANETFQATLNELDKRENERVKATRSQRPSKPIPSHAMPRWSVVSTSLIFIVFAIFISTALSESFFPEGEIITGNGGILNPHTLFILGGVALTAIVLGLVFRPQLLLSAQKGEDAGIPWDTIYVILTGVIFIIIGVGLIFWVRSLALAAG